MAGPITQILKISSNYNTYWSVYDYTGLYTFGDASGTSGYVQAQDTDDNEEQGWNFEQITENIDVIDQIDLTLVGCGDSSASYKLYIGSSSTNSTTTSFTDATTWKSMDTTYTGLWHKTDFQTAARLLITSATLSSGQSQKFDYAQIKIYGYAPNTPNSLYSIQIL